MRKETNNLELSSKDWIIDLLNTFKLEDNIVLMNFWCRNLMKERKNNKTKYKNKSKTKQIIKIKFWKQAQI